MWRCGGSRQEHQVSASIHEVKVSQWLMKCRMRGAGETATYSSLNEHVQLICRRAWARL